MSGIFQLTDGQFLNAFSGGQTQVGNDSLTVIFGTNSHITAGVDNELFLGATFSYHAGMQAEASYSVKTAIHKGASLTSELEKEDYYVDSYSTAVGASTSELGNIKRYRLSLFLLLTLQAGILAATGGTAIGYIMNATDDEKKTDLGVPTKVGRLLTVLNALGPVIAIIYAAYLTAAKKTFASAAGISPNAALSLHETGAVFLGNRKEAPPLSGDGNSAGMVIDPTGLELSASKTLRDYVRNDAIIRGFQNAAEGEDGATLKLHNTGMTVLNGKDFIANLKAPTAGDAQFEAKANNLKLQVMEQNGTVAAQAFLSLMKDEVSLKANDAHFFTAKEDEVRAAITKGSGAEMKLTNNDATLRHGNMQVKVEAGKISVGELTIDASGLKFGALTVFDPAAPAPLPPVQPPANAPQVVNASNASQQQQQQKQLEDDAAKAVVGAQIGVSQASNSASNLTQSTNP